MFYIMKNYYGNKKLDVTDLSWGIGILRFFTVILYKGGNMTESLLCKTTKLFGFMIQISFNLRWLVSSKSFMDISRNL